MVKPHLRFPIYLSLVAAIATVGLKTPAESTNSVGLLSDVAESVVNLITAVTAYLALHYAARTVDRSHQYGHGNIEHLFSGFEGALILAAAVSIGFYAVRRLIWPVPLEPLAPVSSFPLATAINGAVAFVLLRTGRKHESIILEADGWHLLANVWTSLGVLLGLAWWCSPTVNGSTRSWRDRVGERPAGWQASCSSALSRD